MLSRNIAKLSSTLTLTRFISSTRLVQTSRQYGIPPEKRAKRLGNNYFWWNNYYEIKKKFEQGELKQVVVIDNMRVAGSFDTVGDAHYFIGDNEMEGAYTGVVGLDNDNLTDHVIVVPHISRADPLVTHPSKVLYLQSGIDYPPESFVHGRGPYRPPFDVYLYGPFDRLYAKIAVKSSRVEDFQYVNFLVDTGSPSTFINEEVRKSLGFLEDYEYLLDFGIGKVGAQPSTEHWTPICLLGTDAMKRLKLEVNYPFRTASVLYLEKPAK